MADLPRLDQSLAAAAAQALAGGVDDTLRTRMRSLPALVHTSGLTATAAFLLAPLRQRHRRLPQTQPRALLNDAGTQPPGLTRSPADARQTLGTGRPAATGPPITCWPKPAPG
ncbi:type III-B CRISPR module-associated protein Cmr5 [Kutzneria sp. 744]|uniref:type III-B CRISPR module-associated protein Cmr5 n=1 Tax=Kutzneria sp. (strain 744) TaxID=345341 RepID=UPI0004B9695B|nr:type III-B CRISPR module-associated protein Cmr5 [Kutzneria sp. 744]